MSRTYRMTQAFALVAIGSLLTLSTLEAAPGEGRGLPSAELAASEGTPKRHGELPDAPLLALARRNEAAASKASQAGKKPNILVIFGDDIGQANISAYTMGLMGYRTPNIDRIAREGMIFTDYYAEQSCTAGRSSFLTGQCTFRTGLSKVGVPGSPVGLKKEDPTIAELLKPLGYATGQFGKNHLGDLNEYLPTVHGFDEFFGNLYHLNAEEEPEQRTYPRDPKFKEMFGPRGVLKCKATDVDDPTDQPRWGRVGKQTIEDTGALTKKRMETIDDETSDAAVDYLKRQTSAGKPFFCWFNSTRMHFRTHVAADRRSPPGLTARTEYADGMVEHDGHVGKLLKALDDLGIADDTIVLYTTDNGPHMNSWPDAAMTPFRNEKNSNWEGAFRVPCVIRWPGKIKAGSVSNEIVSGHDWLPTLLAAAGEPDIKEKLKNGHEASGTTYKVHIDGYDQSAYLSGQAEKSTRRGFFYFNDDGDLVSLRVENWKVVFMEQRATGTLRVWAEPFTPLRLPKLFDLRADPYERADVTSNTYYDWLLSQPYLILAAQTATVRFLETFKDFPPRQRAPSFSVDQAVQKMKQHLGSD
ncbi:arylsulfatase [Isosphaeraceae bacterium EP7]